MKAVLTATWNEAVRKKTFLVMTIIFGLFLVLWAVLLYFYRREVTQYETALIDDMASRFILQLGMQFSSQLLTLLAVMLGAGAVSGDLETGIAHAVLSRPIRRAAYLGGKLLGLAAMMALYASALWLLLLGLARVFALPTVALMPAWRFFAGWALFLLTPLAILFPTLWGSVRMRTVPCGILMIFVYILGYIGGMTEMIGNLLSNQNVISVGIFLSLISPFHTLYGTAERVLLPANNMVDEVLGRAGGLQALGKAPSVWMYVYAGVYCIALAAMAYRHFRQKDIT